MPAPSLAYPTINGNRPSWSSVEIVASGKRYLGVKAINFSVELKPGDIRGTHAQRLARTQGDLIVTAGMEMYLLESDDFYAGLAVLGAGQLLGPGEVEFDVIINYRLLPGFPISTRTLQRCRAMKLDDSHQQSIEGLTTKFTLDPMDLLRNGVSMLGPNALGSPLV